MVYIVECRLAQRRTEENAPSERPQRLFFLYSFTDGSLLKVEEVREISQTAIEVAKKEVPRLHIDVRRIEVREGSIDIIIIVNSVAIDPTGGVIAGGILLGSGVLWVADKALGGVLGEFGKRVASYIWDKVSGKRQEPDKLCNPLVIADGAAKRVAEERRAAAAIFSGPFSVNGTIQCTYELLGSDMKYVTITVNKSCQGDPIVRVHN